MMSKAIRDLPSIRNQPLKSADGNKYIRILKNKIKKLESLTLA